MPDSRSLETILTDLDHADFEDLVLIADRCYNTLRILEKYLLRGQPAVMCVKTGQRIAVKAINELGVSGAHLDEVAVDSEAKIYHNQYAIDCKVESTGQSVKSSDRLRLNHYFTPVRRGLELIELNIALSLQETALSECWKKRGHDAVE